jgi:hypothetical protein
MPSRDWPIIVGGCHRSGTSLLRRILDAHSRIFCGPEVKFFQDFYSGYVQDPIRHGRFFTTARMALPEAELLELFGSAFVKLHERAAARAGKVRWADKCPENVVYLDDWARLLGDRWLFVHVVRNPLDTLASIKEIRFPFAIPSGLGARIDFYKRYFEAGLAFGAAAPDRYHRIVYEELVREPRTTLEGLHEWLGEVFELEQLSFNARPHQNGLEDPKVGRTERIHDESVGRWRQVLDDDEAAEIVERCAVLWRQIDADGRWWAPPP